MNIFIYVIIAVAGLIIIRMIVRRLKPTWIKKEAKRLRDLFLAKEHWDGYTVRLNELGQNDVRNEALDNSVREEYQQEVAKIIEEIGEVKRVLRRSLEDKQKIYQAYQVESERLAAKFKTGEIPLNKYEDSERKLQRKTELIEPDIKAIERLLSAESSRDV